MRNYLSNYWSLHAPLLEIANFAYQYHAESKDSYYNRYLYKALREVVNSLATEEEHSFNNKNTLTALFRPSDFDDGATSTSFDAAIATGIIPTEGDLYSDWKKGLYSLNRSQLHAIERAVTMFLWLSDKVGYIKFNKNSQSPEGFAISVSIVDRLVFAENIDNIFDQFVNNFDIEEKALVKDIRRLNNICQKLIGSAIEESLDDPILRYYISTILNPNQTKLQRTLGLRNRFSFMKKILKQKLDELHDTTLTDNLISRLDELLMKEIATTSSLIVVDDTFGKYIKMPLPEGGFLVVTFNLKKEYQKELLERSDTNFLVTVNDKDDISYTTTKLFRQFKLTKQWGNYEEIFRRIVSKGNELRRSK